MHSFEVKRKLSPCADSPPAGAHIINHNCSSPSGDDTLIDADYQNYYLSLKKRIPAIYAGLFPDCPLEHVSAIGKAAGDR